MTEQERDEAIKNLKRLYRETYGRRKGVVVDSFHGQEVGIHTFNYVVLTKNGICRGYWTDREPTLSERTIACRIADSEDCEYWDCMEDEELADAAFYF